MRFRIYFKGLFAGIVIADDKVAAVEQAAKLFTAVEDTSSR